jgi:putative transposase
VHLLRNSSATPGASTGTPSPKPCGRSVYTPPTEVAALERFYEFVDTWGSHYPAIVRLWENAWAEFVPFPGFDVEIRKVICSTNAIESVNARSVGR